MIATQWTEVREFEDFVAEKKAGFILKHSTRCPISAAAYREFEAFTQSVPEVPAHVVLVVEHRPVSNAITEKLGIPHASPQVLLVREGAVLWHTSHGGITRGALGDAWGAAEG